MKYISALFVILFFGKHLFAQKVKSDTTQHLNEVEVIGTRERIQIERLPDVHGTYLTAGKKNEVIQLSGVNANIAERTPRQIFAKIPGIFVYDMDGSGNQINVSTRGLDPHRSWEFNLRYNGVIGNTDMYGYPASHYNPPAESFERVEIVRGTGSLQYGAQFGGMINYVSKQADTTKRFSFESINSAGSYGLLSSYNAIGGRVGKMTYYAYYHRRNSSGYRQNSRSESESQFVRLQYDFTSKLSLKAEVGHTDYVYQIPVPLTDSMFYANPRMSTRSRNYYEPDIYLPSLTLNWEITPRTQLKWTNSMVLGFRNSVMIDAFATVKDAMETATGQYKNRQVDIDKFNSFTSELRLLHYYQLGAMSNVLVGGIQVMNNDLNRRQLGKGTVGSDYDLTLLVPNDWGRDIHFKTKNVALFVENLLYITPKLSVSPGFRLESGKTDFSGSIRYLKPEVVPNSIPHRFPLFGMSVQYQIDKENRLYGGFSQAYRPVILKDIIPASVLERADKNLKDAYGYNAEIGLSGRKGRLHYDLSAFLLQYNNRLGSLILNNPDGTSYIFRTNIGDSRTKGLEMYVEYEFIRSNKTRLSAFTSTAYMDARYVNGKVSNGKENQSIEGNKVESVPEWTSRNGIEFNHRWVSATLLASYVSASFADAFNTVLPTANGAKGIVPSYTLVDLNTTFHLTNRYTIRFGINNMLNKSYFTKRPTFYPGPGIWPSDGRSVVMTVGVKL
ncbi:TonB-dependent receptor domain-containing protein [Runella sp.]|uniref:TonB-dependent receptor family protein n=1 Tax=Runella sp. TaxID=1960881 RepID=UPI0026388A88|nr:TonB-dependent receptor [Runella sp.]